MKPSNPKGHPVKLTAKQREALDWLTDGPWRTSWWGGKPHTGWPKQMPVQTYNSLSLAKLIKTHSGSWAEKTVSITMAGREALAAKR